MLTNNRFCMFMGDPVSTKTELCTIRISIMDNGHTEARIINTDSNTVSDSVPPAVRKALLSLGFAEEREGIFVR